MTEDRVTIIDGREPQNERGRSGTAVLFLVGALILAVAILAIFGVFSDPDPGTQARPLPTVGTTAPTTTTTISPEEVTVLEYEADVVLIEQLWWDQTIAWAGGFDSGLRFWVENNYPDMGCTVDHYMMSWFPNGSIEGLYMERVVNSPTIARDDGWLIPGGKLEGVPARGRVYVMSVRDTVTRPDRDPQPPAIRNYHVTILDGQAHFFIGCPI